MVWCSWGKVDSLATGSTKEVENLTDSQKGFLEVLVPIAQQTAREYSLLPSVLLSQAILESSWGTSRLAVQGNNLFGIKADSSWQGDTIEIVTTEVRKGQTGQEKHLFRKYPSWKASLADYGRFFTSNAWRAKNYQQYRNAKDYKQALEALQTSNYATDPKYGEKLRSLLERYSLHRLDN